MLLLILILLSVVKTDLTTRDDCDLIELNSFFDCNARHVYDQVIFYEWSPSLDRYHVRAWVLSDNDKQPQRDYRTGLFVVRYTDRDSNISRAVVSPHYRRSFTQIDPERANKRLLEESERHGLVKRLPPKPIPDEAPMAIDFIGGME